MLRSYNDIRSRIRDAIRWWDDNGVPRYCDFSPEECGVYDVVVALVEVGCQACTERFRVAVTFDRESQRQVGDRYALPAAGNIGTFRYGDPPSHSRGADGCVGNTMSSESIRVLELWQRDQQNWIRHPECEIYIGEQEHEGATLDEF
jgi:hypothetical protein